MSKLVDELGHKKAKVTSEREELASLLLKMEKVKAEHEEALASKTRQLQDERAAAETVSVHGSLQGWGAWGSVWNVRDIWEGVEPQWLRSLAFSALYWLVKVRLCRFHRLGH